MAAALLLGVLGGCFTSIFVPPTFRYACETDDDCRPTVDEVQDSGPSQRCISGLCQYPCTGSPLAAVEGECPEDFFGCFNGVCATLCQLDDKLCSAPMRCLEFDIPPEFEALLGGGFGGGVDLDNTGICGIRCDDEGAMPCPEGQMCLEGACIDPTALAARGGGLHDASLGPSAAGVVDETCSTPGTAASRLLASDEISCARRRGDHHHELLGSGGAP